MSKKEKTTPEQGEKKIVTSYDRKVQKRKEQAAKEAREKKIARIVGVVILVALVCLVASFPIRTYLAINETYAEIGGEKVSRVEFDYNYYLTVNNYNNQYGLYLSYMGLDLSGDLSQQMYSDTLTWEDFFQEMTVEGIRQNKALLAEAKAEGFEYDTDEEFDQYKQTLKEQASSEGKNLNAFVKEAFGPYATMSRLEKYIRNAITASAYYEKVEEEKAPTEEEILAYYEENTDSYDSVDYRVTQIDAELPTEPTDLADPQEETEDTEAEDGSEEEEAYEPSDAEIEYAMAQAKEKADEAEKTVATDGELQENVLMSSVNSNYSDWLFDAERKAGDTTVVEDTANNRYYVVAFVDRYRDDAPTVNARVIFSTDTDGQTILDEWKAGEATEDSFIELWEKYNGDTYYVDGGLYEGLTKSSLDEESAAWLYDESRVEGDVTVITVGEDEDVEYYVIYYKGEGDPEWKQSIRSTLLSQTMSDYLMEISEPFTVEDPKGKLNYLKVQAAESEAAASAETEETGEESTEGAAE